jgi:hypothetical protein
MTNQKPQTLVRKMQARTAELHVSEAAVFATALVARSRRAERRDPYEAVASNLEGCSRGRIWTLVHRPRTLKSIASHIREGLASAYARECERQRKLLEHEIAIAKIAGASRSVLRAAADMGGVVLCSKSGRSQ